MTQANQSAFASEDPHQALLRAVRFCHPGWDLVGGLTFREDRRASPVWKNWQETVFHPAILPQIVAAHAAVSQGNLQALMECDAALNAALPAASSVASKLSGQRLAANYSVPPGEKLLGRYAQRIISGETPGHLAVFMAARAAVFHFSPATAVAAYCFLEAKGGLKSGSIIEWMDLVSDCAAAAQGFGGAALRAA